MTDSTTSLRDKSAGEFCGNCGEPVKFYWASCANCHTPLDVKPIGSASTPRPTTAPEPPLGRSWPANGSDASPTQVLPAAADEPPPPAWTSPTRSYGPPRPNLAATSLDHWSSNASASTTAQYPAAPGAPPSPSYERPPAPPSYEPQAPAYTAPPAYERPPQYQAPSYQPPPPYQPPASSFQPSYNEPAKAKTGRSLGLLITAIALGVLLIGAIIFGAISAGNLSSTTKDRDKQVTALHKAQNDLAAAAASLNDANSTKASQSSQLAAYKTCISDLNILFNATPGSAAETAADKQAQKDCIPLGLG